MLDHIVTVRSYTAHSYHWLFFLQLRNEHMWPYMEEGLKGFVFTNRIFIFIETMYNSVIRQAENDLDAGLPFFGIRDIGLSLWRHNFRNVRQINAKTTPFNIFIVWNVIFIEHIFNLWSSMFAYYSLKVCLLFTLKLDILMFQIKYRSSFWDVFSLLFHEVK